MQIKKRIYITIFVLLLSLITILVLKNPTILGNVTLDNLYKEDYKCKDCNIILISIDTLRADHLGVYGYERDTSPNIDELAEDSFIFKNSYSSASWTRSAIASILTSKLPIEHGINSERKKERLEDDFFTIQEFFNERNYSTAAIYTNPHLNFGLVQNFSYTNYKGNRWADKTYDKAINWLESNSDNKFFLLVHNNDPHDSYDFHKGFNFSQKNSKYRRLGPFFPTRIDGNKIGCENQENITQLNEEQLSEMMANYDEEIAFTDHHFGRLINYLKKNKLDKKTVIIFTADHGEEFLEHGRYWHGCSLYDELIRVPLMINLPEISGNKFKQKVSTIDIFPTLVEIFDRDNLDKYSFSGQSLLPLIENRNWEEKPIFSSTAFKGPLKYSLIKENYKIIKYAEGPIIGIYDLDKDPEESKNLKNDPLFNYLQDSLQELIELKSNDLTKKDKEKSEIDEETLEQLKSLGYMN